MFQKQNFMLDNFVLRFLQRSAALTDMIWTKFLEHNFIKIKPIYICCYRNAMETETNRKPAKI